MSDISRNNGKRFPDNPRFISVTMRRRDMNDTLRFADWRIYNKAIGANSLVFNNYYNDLFEFSQAGQLLVNAPLNDGISRIISNGRISASSYIIPNGTASQSLQANGSTIELSSGIYNPNILAVANLNWVTTNNDFRWYRIGNIVTVSGVLSYSDISKTGFNICRIPLPIPSNLPAIDVLSLSGIANQISSLNDHRGFLIQGFGASTNISHAEIQWTSTINLTTQIRFQFSYSINY